MSQKPHPRKKPTGKQIAAVACIVILVALYVITLIVAIFDHSAGMRFFSGCLVATIGLPILLWIYILVYGYYSKKKTIADLNILGDPAGENKKEEPDNGSGSSDQ
ncbi:MAG: hypothetical protein K6A92_11255 [Lachnospiraceae bacterium]|nr:hypothetical protein [Lachnospiraceae bacterium]